MTAAVNCDLLNENGLNMQAIFDLAALPEAIRIGIDDQIADYSDYRQLILIAHGGRRMWEALQASGFMGYADPVDSFSIDLAGRWAAEVMPEVRSEVIYPAAMRVVPLQALGALAGWHHPSPFRIGINQTWGSWFAYRAAILVDSDFAVTRPMLLPSPCENCLEKPCLAACPAKALSSSESSLKLCTDFRLSQNAICENQCPARDACLIATEHRYSDEQVNYHYSLSLQMIQAWQKGH